MLDFEEHLKKGKVVLDSFLNFAYASSYLNLKGFARKRKISS